MRSLTSLEYSFLLNELKKIFGKYFTKVYQVAENKFRFKFGDIEITCEPGVRLNISKYIEQGEGEAKGFVRAIREELENKRVKDVYQQNKDRIIVIEFEREELKLIFEMFGKGNIILVKGEETIAAMKEEEWSDRVIKKGEKYNFPKSNVAENIETVISEKYIIVSMMQLPLGKEYAKEALIRCSIDEKKQGSKLTNDEIKCIEKEIHEIVKSAKPYGFYENKELVNYGLTEFKAYEALEKKEFETFSELLEEYYMKQREDRNEELEKLQFRLDEQTKKLEEMKNEETEYKKIGDYLYENYEEIEKILNTAKESNSDEIETKLKKYNIKVNKKEKEIEIEC